MMSAARKLEPASPAHYDPVLAAFDSAPLGDPFSNEERAAFEIGIEDIRAGRIVTTNPDETSAMIEHMRCEQGE